MITVAIVTSGLGLGLGLMGVVTWWSPPSDEASPARRRVDPSLLRSAMPRVALAGFSAVVVGLATGWPVAVPITAVAVYGLPKLLDRTAAVVSIEKLEAIATWTEMLQGTLAASAGLTQAIVATAALSPGPIRGSASRLSARLTAGSHPRDALLQFADELGDPSVDRVVCALVLAVSARAQRLGDLLSALADSTREEVALRLRIETSRSSVRSGVRTVVVFSVVFAAGLTLLAHSYLEPFGSAPGQAVLGAVGLLYGIGLAAMVSLSRPPAPVRMLGNLVEAQ
jgi:tight adherence protein B